MMLTPQDSYRRDGYYALLGTILAAGRDSPMWFTSWIGRFWCGIAGLEPQTMFEMAAKKRRPR